MTEPNFARPGSSAAASHGESIPSSPRPSVASRASRSSLRRDRERPDTSSGQPRPPSPQPAPFAPLFTLITSNTHPSPRHTNHHPFISYIFADDDPELLTAALSDHNNHPGERAVVLDLSPTADGAGYDVVRASSLAPDWAVVSASVSRMGGMQRDSGAALMLRVEGVSVEPGSGGKASTPPEGELQSSGGSGPRAVQRQNVVEEYAALLSDFDKRMGVLRRVVDAGGAVGERGEVSNPAGEVFSGSVGGLPAGVGGRESVDKRNSTDAASSTK